MKRSPLKRKTRLSPVSSKRKEEMKEYSAKRKKFLAAHPICQMCGKKKSTDIHHTKKRYGGNYLDVSTWKALCRYPCHQFIHDHGSWARENGWLE